MSDKEKLEAGEDDLENEDEDSQEFQTMQEIIDENTLSREQLLKLLASTLANLYEIDEELQDDELIESLIFAIGEIEEALFGNRYDPGCACIDCGEDTTPKVEDITGLWEWYVVHDHIWKEAGMQEEGFLCIGCLETRLGRELTPDDFTDDGINKPSSTNTARLASRIESNTK